MDQIFARNPAAVAVVESALIFEVERDARARGESESVLADWRRRLDRIIVVTAPDELKIARYAARVCPAGAGRAAAEADARLRLAHQIPDAVKPPVPTMSLIIQEIRKRSGPGEGIVAAPQGQRATCIPQRSL